MTTTIGSLDLNAFSDLYSDSNQYFWFESDATATYGAGVHVTLVPDTTFISNPTGQNILMNTDGFSIRNGLLPMMTLDNDSLDFNAVDTSLGTYTTMATFGLTGATIGQTSGAHSVIDTNGQRFYASDGTTQLANIGYGLGTDSGGGTSNAPYYTLGFRNNGTIGNYSVCEGSNTKATNYAAHAEGSNTQALGPYSHAEGGSTIARSQCSHAEGGGCHASGNYAHAEGRETSAVVESHSEGSHTEAQAIFAHVQNVGTITGMAAQTVIGTFNTLDTKPTSTGLHNGMYIDEHVIASMDFGNWALVIGNGTADDARSNALTVDWKGGIQMYLDSNGTSSSAATSGDDMDLFNAIYNLGWYSDVIV